MKSPRLKTVLKGASAIGLVAVMTTLASVPAVAQSEPDRVAQKNNDPRDHVRAANCVQSTHEGQTRAAERVAAFAAFGCATQENDADRAEDQVTEAFGTGTVPTGDNGGSGDGTGGGGGDGTGGGGGDGTGGGGGDGTGGGGDTTSSQSSIIFLSLAEGPTDESGAPALDSLAIVTVGTQDPNAPSDPALIDLRVGEGVIGDGEGGTGNLQITVLDAVNGDGDSTGFTGTPLDGVANIDATTAPSGGLPPDQIDGLAEVNLGSDPDQGDFNAVQVNAFNDEVADIGHVTVADGWFDESATLPEGDMGTELIGIDLGEDPTNNENDNTAQVTLDNAGFTDLGDALGISSVDVIDPQVGPDGPTETNLVSIDGNPEGGLAPLVDLFRTSDATDPGTGDGTGGDGTGGDGTGGGETTDPVPLSGSSSLLSVGVADAPTDESGMPVTDSLASVTIGSTGTETEASDPALVEATVGDGLLTGPDNTEGYLDITLVDALNGEGDSAGITGTPLDGVVNVEGSGPSTVTEPSTIDSLAEVNAGSDPDADGFTAVQVDALDDSMLSLATVTVGDGTFDEGAALTDGSLGSELVGVDLAGDTTGNENDNTAQVTLDNQTLAEAIDPLGVDSADVVSPDYSDQRTLAELDGNPDGLLAPVVDAFRTDSGDPAFPASTSTAQSEDLNALPGEEDLPETSTLVSALPEELRNITAIQNKGSTGTVSSDITNGGGEGTAGGTVLGTTTGLVGDTLSNTLGLLGR